MAPPILPVLAAGTAAIGAGRALLDQRRPPPEEPEPTWRSNIDPSFSPERRREIEGAYRRLGLPTGRRVAPPPRPEPEDPGVLGTFGDLATSATAGALDAAGGVANLTSVVPRTLGLPEVSSDIAGGLHSAADFVRERGLSPAAQQQAQQFANTLDANKGKTLLERITGTAGALADNPRYAANLTAEMAPMMVGAGLIGRGLQSAGAVSRPLTGAAIGEGTISAGLASSAIREGTGGDNPAAELAALPIGVATAAVPMLGGSLLSRMAARGTGPAARVATALNAADPESLIAGASRSTAPLAARVPAGAFREGVLEELPQTLAEGSIQNIATGQPVGEGLAEDATVGTILGGVTGGAFGIPGGPRPAAATDTAAEPGTAEPGTAEPPAVDPLVQFPRPEKTGVHRAAWDEAAAAMATEGVETQDQAREVLRNTKGIGPKILQNIERTDWFKSLPKEPAAPAEGAAPTESTAPVRQYEVPPDPEAEAVDAAEDAAFAADVEEALQLPPDPDAEPQPDDIVDDSDTLKATESSTGDEPQARSKLGSRQTGRIQPHPRYNMHRAIYSMIRGVYPDSPTATRRLERGSEQTRADTAPWRRAANVASAVLSPVDTTGVLNEGETVLDLANRIHNTTRRMERLNNLLGTQDALPTMGDRGPRNALSRDAMDALKANAGKDTGTGTAELAIFDELDTAMERNPDKSPEELIGEIVKDKNLGYEQVLQLYQEIARDLDEEFTQLEELVGRDNLMLAMYAGKKAQFNQARQRLPGDRLRSEPADAVRFNQFYRKFREGSTGDTMVGGPGANIREESELARRLSPIVDGSNPAQLERVAAGETLPPNVQTAAEQSGQGRSRVNNVLTHIRLISQTPGEKRLASALMDVAAANGLDTAAGDGRLSFVVSDEASAPGSNGRVFGQFTPAAPDPARPDAIGTVEIYRRGANARTILHEITHALTVSAMRNSPNSPGAKNLATIAKHLSRFGRSGKELENIRTKYGEQTAHILSVLNDLQTSDTPDRAALELITYGLTNAEFQNFMKQRKYTGPALSKINPRNLWNAFRGAVARLLGAGSVPNNVMDAVLEASAGVLYDAASETKLGPSTATPLEASGPGRNIYRNPNSTAAQVESSLRKNLEHTSRASYKAAAEALANQKKRRKEAKQQQAAQTVGPRAAAYAADQGKTQVATDAPVPARDVLLTDRALRNMMDSIVGLLSGGAVRDWETGSQALLDKGGQGLIEWAAQRNNLAQRVTMSVLQGTIDRVGIDPQADNLLSRAVATLHKGTHDSLEAYNILHTASPEVQQAALDYLENRDENALRASIVGDRAEDVANQVINLVRSMEQVALEAAMLGRLDPEFIDPATQEVDLRPLLRPSKGSKLHLGRRQETGEIKAFRSTSVRERVENDAHILGDQGKRILKQPGPDVRYYRAHDSNGEVFFIDTRASAATRKRLDLVIDAEDNLPYRLATKLNAEGTARMERYKTAQELREGKMASEVIPSMINTLHHWTRLVTFDALTDQMVADNQRLEPDAAYIRDNVDDVPVERLLTPESVEESSKRGFVNVQARMTKLARTPGTWVKLPDVDEPGAREWGAMAGKWVAGPVYAAMKDQSNEEPIINSENYQTFLRIWKKNKTVWSPGTHMMNVAGNFILMYMHDIPYSEVRRSYKLLLQDWASENQDKFDFAKRYIRKNPLTAEERALVNEFKSSGATLGQFKTADFDMSSFAAATRHAEEQSNEDDGSNRGLVKGLMGMEGVTAQMIKGLSATDDVLMDTYSNQDNVFRMAAYVTHLKRAVDRNGGQSTVQIKEEAAKHANESFVNYNVTAPWVRAMRGTITPFIMFPYRMVPLIARLSVTKPWKTATVLGTIYALNALGYAASGGDEDREQRLIPEYMKDTVWGFPNVPTYIRMPFSLDDGETPVFYPLGAMVPVASALTLDPSGSPRMFAASGPFITALYAAIGYDPFLQRNLREEGQSVGEDLMSTAGYLFRGLAPQVGVSAYKAVDNQLVGGGKLGPMGSEPSAFLDVARIMGLNMTQVNLPELQMRQGQALQRIKSDFGTARNRYIRNHLRRGDADPADIREYIIQNRERMLEAIEEELQ